jgi:hypothetical protein
VPRKLVWVEEERFLGLLARNAPGGLILLLRQEVNLSMK